MAPSRVVLVEEDSHQRALLAQLLRGSFEQEGVEILSASDVETAAGHLIKGVDLVLLDLDLPGHRGRQAFDALAPLLGDAAIVIVNGDAEESLARDLIRAGAHDYLIKGPLDDGLFRRTVRHALERKAWRRSLRGSEPDFAAQYQHAPTPLLTWRREGGDFTLESYNNAAHKISDGRIERLIGKRVSEAYRDLPAIPALMQRAYDFRETLSAEMHSANRMVEQMTDAVITATFVPPDRVMMYVEDITPRKAVEAALRASEAKFRAHFEQSPIPIFVWRTIGDDDFEYVEFNAAAERFSRGRAAGLRGTLASVAYSSHPDLLALMRRCRRERSPERIEVDYLFAEKELRRVDITIGFVEPDLLLFYLQDVTEIRGTELALRESERNYRILFERAPIGIVIADTQMTILESNEKAREMFGMSEEDLKGLRFFDVVPPETLKANPLKVDLLLETGSLRHERLLRRRDGSTFPAEITAVRLDEARVLAMARDLTEEHRARQQATFQANLLANVQNAVIATDPAGLVIYWNDRAERLFGWTEPEALGQPIMSLNVPVESEAFAQALTSSLETTGHWAGEFDAKRKDGSAVHIYTTLAAITDSQGEFAGLVGVSFDLTERDAAEQARRKAETALMESEKHFRSMIEHSSDITSVLLPGGSMEYQSPSIQRILGYAPSDLLGRNILDFIHRDDRPTARATIEGQIADPEPRSFEAQLRHADGSWRSFHIVTQTVRTAEGEIRLIANARDITERNQLAKKLEQANRISDLGRLATIIAHEINNVMMGISPFAEVIQHRTSDPSIIKAAEQISRSIQRGKRITQQILRFAQPAEPSFSIVSASHFLDSIRSEVVSYLPADVRIKTECDPNLQLRIDPELMTQVLTNLLLNARDALPGGGTVTVRCSQQGERAVIEVSDSGTGMSQEVARQAFDPLFTTKRSGTGLGLAIVRQIITDHQGEIHVATAPSEGTTFRIDLPTVDARAGAPRAATPPKTRLPGAMRVLLAEDDHAVAAGLTALLEAEGFVTAVVELGKEVDQAIERFKPELLLLDYGLPDESGADVFTRVAERWPELPVVFSTGHADQAIIRGLSGSPRVGYLLKPYETEALLAEIQRVTGAARSN